MSEVCDPQAVAPGRGLRPASGEYMGELELGVAVRAGRSVATHQYHTRALKIIRPHYLDDSGQVCYIVVNPGGGFVDGDAYRMEIAVKTGASLLLTDQSAAKVYRTPQRYVSQEVHFKVGPNAVLEYLPNQLILYRGADFRQQVVAEVDPEGTLFFSEIVTPGWSPRGERFGYRQAWLRNRVLVGGELTLVDNLRFIPGSQDWRADADFLLGGHTHVGTAVCISPGVTPELVAEVRAVLSELSGGAAGLIASVSETSRPGFVMRGLANRTEELASMIGAVADLVRARLRGQGRVNLRQY